MGCLSSIEKKVYRTYCMNNPASPRSSFALAQRRRAFPAERRCQLTADSRIFVIQVLVAEGIRQASDLVETRLHFFGYLLRRAAFGHCSYLPGRKKMRSSAFYFLLRFFFRLLLARPGCNL